MPKRPSKKTVAERFAFWTVVIVPSLTLVAIYWGLFNDKEKVVPRATENVKPTPLDNVQKSGSPTRQIKYIPSTTNTIEGEGSLNIKVTNPSQGITVRCTNCKTFSTQPEELFKSDVVTFKFSVRKISNDPGQTITLLISNGEEQKTININVIDPDHLSTITL